MIIGNFSKIFYIYALALVFTYFCFELMGLPYVYLFGQGDLWDEAAGALIGGPTAFLFFAYFCLVFFFGLKRTILNIIIYATPALVVLLLEYWFYPQSDFLMGFIFLGFYYPFVFGFLGLGLGLLARRLYTISRGQF
jgi:hypothetical protein